MRVDLTAYEAEQLHAALSMILNDPDWEGIMGGRRQILALDRVDAKVRGGE